VKTEPLLSRGHTVPLEQLEHYGNITHPRDGRMGKSHCGLFEMAIQWRGPISH